MLFSLSEEFDVPLEDIDGKSLGSITFRPGTGDTVAEVVFNTSMAARAMTRGVLGTYRIYFLKNSSWPVVVDRSARKGYFKRMDIKSENLSLMLDPTDRKPTYVCIREAKNGQHPWWLALTLHEYEPDKHDNWDAPEVPDLDMAKQISAELRTDFDLFKDAFSRAGGGGLYWDRDIFIDCNGEDERMRDLVRKSDKVFFEPSGDPGEHPGVVVRYKRLHKYYIGDMFREKENPGNLWVITDILPDIHGSIYILGGPDDKMRNCCEHALEQFYALI